MSFILDALKKSEAQRQRADAPALYEMKMAPPRQRVPAWLLVLGGLLIINIGVLCVVLLRGNHSAAPQADANASSTEARTTAAPAAAMTPAPAAANPPAASGPAMPPDAAATLNRAPSAADRADDTPAVEPAPAPAVANGPSSGDVPTYDQAASTPGANLPELKLDLHAYATNPADRFVFLNMTKLKEGESSPAGVRVESITPDGAILSWQGSRFFLQRQ
jgi:general secretion pathway protein B